MSLLDRRQVLGAMGAFGAAGLGGWRPLHRRPDGQDGAQDGVADEASDLRALVEGQTAFALDLHRALTAASPAANAFHSPLSVWTAFAMVHEGARGATREELARTLRVPEPEGHRRLAATPLRTGMAKLRRCLADAGESVTLATADALWVDDGFALNPATLEAVRSTYAAEVTGLDFRGAPEAARARVNAWVKDKTAGKIEDLLPEGAVTVRTRLVLTDAVHFLGTWRTPFDPRDTSTQAFRRSDGSTTQAPFMYLTEATVLAHATLDAKGAPRDPWPPGQGGTTWVELPYAGDAVSFVAIVPDEYGALPAFERSLDAAKLAAGLAQLRPQKVKLRMPRFAAKPRYELAAPLSALGVKAAFQAGEADLTGFAAPEAGEGRDLYVTSAHHAAALTVDEQGTEAAAATGAVIGSRSLEPFIDLDRPFLYLIRERTSGALLFMGRLTDPSR